MLVVVGTDLEQMARAPARNTEPRHPGGLSRHQDCESLQVACRKGCGISFLGAFLLGGRGMEEMTLEGLPSLCCSCQLAEQLAGEVAAAIWTITLCVLVSKVAQQGQERSVRWLLLADLLDCLNPSLPFAPLGGSEN